MTGGAGCIGSRLIAHFLERGRPYKSLVRGTDWDVPVDASDLGRADPALFSGARAVIHLAGEPLTTGRWTNAKMDRIRLSRVEGTRLIARSCARAETRPDVLIVASGTGYYGSRGDEELTEQSGVGSGFLAEVARDWEAAAAPAAEVGIRVVFLRMGAVISKDGGLLRESWPWARAGLLAKVWGPKRWVSWIGMQDLVEIVEWAIERETLVGPVNAVADKGKLPDGVRGREWHLTEFLDSSSPRPGTDELYLTKAADQSPVERPPLVVWEEYDPWPWLFGTIALLAAVLMGFMVWKVVKLKTKA